MRFNTAGRFFAAAVATLALTASGCGRDPSSSPKAQKTQSRQRAAQGPCSLLEPADLKPAVGADFGRGRQYQGVPPIPVVGMQYCIYLSRPTPHRAPPTVYVGLATQFARESFDKYRNALGAGAQPVSSLGSEAVYSEGAPISSLVTLDGDNVIGISLYFVNENARQVAQTLAQKAIARNAEKKGSS